MLLFYERDMDNPGDYELVAQFEDGSFTFGGHHFDYLDADQLTEQRLMEMFDGPQTYAIDPDGPTWRLESMDWTMGMGHHDEA